MDLREVKRLFDSYARKLPTREELEALHKARKPGPLENSLLIRGNLVLEGQHADDSFRLVEEINRIAEQDGTWSKSSIDELLSRSIFEIIGSSSAERAGTSRAQSKALVDNLSTSPNGWIVDLQVAGIAHDCAGITFGKLEFLVDTIDQSPFTQTVSRNSEARVAVTLARVTVAAIDEDSAVVAAERVIDEHFAVLNELCVEWTPSRIQLYRGENKSSFRQSFHRTRKVTGADGSHGHESRITGTFLSRAEMENFIQRRGGERVSNWLAKPTAFGNRVVAAYVIAGTACVEQKPFLAFLLFAVALESVILGGEHNTEITFQLSVRVAHLLGKTAENRKAVAARVKKLYKIRSKIAHRGGR